MSVVRRLEVVRISEVEVGQVCPFYGGCLLGVSVNWRFRFVSARDIRARIDVHVMYNVHVTCFTYSVLYLHCTPFPPSFPLFVSNIHSCCTCRFNAFFCINLQWFRSKSDLYNLQRL